MNGFIAILKELGPLIQALTPLALPFVVWYINKQTKKTTAAQTTDLKAHSDENRDKMIGTVVEATGVHKTLPDT